MSNIMVIDDDTAVLEYIVFALERAGHYVFCITPGPGAKQKFHKYELDLVITDVSMSNGTAFDVLEQLKDEGINVPLIIICGGFKGLSLPCKDSSLVLGAGAILHTPFSVGEFLSAVNKCRRDARTSP